MELPLSAEAARREASRCLDCGVTPVFDGTRCVLCTGCVDVCPTSCLKIVPLDAISPVCTEILEVFDTLIPYQYSEQDRRAGYYFGKDRRGQLHRVPLMSLSIGIVTNQHRRFAHPAQVSELATEMKSYAKTQVGSVFVVDRRRDVDAGESGEG